MAGAGLTQFADLRRDWQDGEVTATRLGVTDASAHDLRRRWSREVMPAVLKELMRHATITTYYIGQNAKLTAQELWSARGNGGGSPLVNFLVNTPEDAETAKDVNPQKPREKT